MLAPLDMAWESSPNVAMSGNQLCTVLQDKLLKGGRGRKRGGASTLRGLMMG